MFIKFIDESGDLDNVAVLWPNVKHLSQDPLHKQCDYFYILICKFLICAFLVIKCHKTTDGWKMYFDIKYECRTSENCNNNKIIRRCIEFERYVGPEKS